MQWNQSASSYSGGQKKSPIHFFASYFLVGSKWAELEFASWSWVNAPFDYASWLALQPIVCVRAGLGWRMVHFDCTGRTTFLTMCADLILVWSNANEAMSNNKYNHEWLRCSACIDIEQLWKCSQSNDPTARNWHSGTRWEAGLWQPTRHRTVNEFQSSDASNSTTNYSHVMNNRRIRDLVRVIEPDKVIAELRRSVEVELEANKRSISIRLKRAMPQRGSKSVMFQQ